MQSIQQCDEEDKALYLKLLIKCLPPKNLKTSLIKM